MTQITLHSNTFDIDDIKYVDVIDFSAPGEIAFLIETSTCETVQQVSKREALKCLLKLANRLLTKNDN